MLYKLLSILFLSKYSVLSIQIMINIITVFIKLVVSSYGFVQNKNIFHYILNTMVRKKAFSNFFTVQNFRTSNKRVYKITHNINKDRLLLENVQRTFS